MPFAGLLGVELTAAAPDEVRATLAWSEERCTTGGILHGGALMSLAGLASLLVLGAWALIARKGSSAKA